MEFDEVFIAEDLNMSIAGVISYLESTTDPILLPEQKEALNLYYVATTRALKKLHGATHLDKYKVQSEEHHEY